MIKILTRITAPGGSTTALVNLTNGLNSIGLDTTLYGPTLEHKGRCKADLLDNCKFYPEDIAIIHALPLSHRLPVKKVIVSCHEKEVFPLKQFPKFWDDVQFVSNSQKQWQDVDGIVIPNIVKIYKKTKFTGAAGVIGYIFEHKQTHVSIKRALDAGYQNIKIFGGIADFKYFQEFVLPMLSSEVVYCGITTNQEAMYNEIDCVFHSSKSETFNLVRQECKLAGIPYFGAESCDPEVELLPEGAILEKWKTLLLS